MEKQVEIVERVSVFSNIAYQTQEIINYVLSDDSNTLISNENNSQAHFQIFQSDKTKEAELKLKSLFHLLPAIAKSPKESRLLIEFLKVVPVKKLFIAVNALKEQIKEISNDQQGSNVILFLALEMPRRDKKWLFSLIEKHFLFLAFQKVGSMLLSALLEKAQNIEFLEPLIKFVLVNICDLVLHRDGVNLVKTALRHMRGFKVVEFLDKFVELNFLKLINNKQGCAFIVRLIELRNEQMLDVQANFVDLINNTLLVRNTYNNVSFLVSKLKENEIHLLSKATRIKQ